MKAIAAHELNQIAGGANLYLTQEINLDGISDACVNQLFAGTQGLISGTINSDSMPDLLSAVCSDEELTILEIKVFMSVPVRVELA